MPRYGGIGRRRQRTSYGIRYDATISEATAGPAGNEAGAVGHHLRRLARWTFARSGCLEAQSCRARPRGARGRASTVRYDRGGEPMIASAAKPIDHVLEHLTGVRKSGKGWVARCPAHEDRHPSLSITEGDDGRVLLHCQSGCHTADVVAKLGLTMAELFPPRESRNGNGRHKANGTARKIATTYDYLNADGEMVYQAVRYQPKGFTQRRPDGRGGWIWNVEGVERVLYHLPALLNSAEDDPDGWVVF